MVIIVRVTNTVIIISVWRTLVQYVVTTNANQRRIVPIVARIADVIMERFVTMEVVVGPTRVKRGAGNVEVEVMGVEGH